MQGDIKYQYLRTQSSLRVANPSASSMSARCAPLNSVCSIASSFCSSRMFAREKCGRETAGSCSVDAKCAKRRATSSNTRLTLRLIASIAGSQDNSRFRIENISLLKWCTVHLSEQSALNLGTIHYSTKTVHFTYHVISFKIELSLEPQVFSL